MTEIASVSMSIDSRPAKRGADDFDRSADKIVRAIKEVDRRIVGVEKKMVALGRASKRAGDNVKKAGADAGRASAGMAKLGSVATRLIPVLGGVGAALAGIAVARDTLRTMVNYEKQLVAVGKTSGLAGAELRDLGRDLTALSLEAPIAAAELLEIAEVAGQLGITGASNIAFFSEKVAQLSRVSNIVGQEGATQLAKLQNVTGEATETIGTMADVLTRLGNNSAETEAAILKVGLEVGKATTVFDIGSTDALAFGAALASIGVEAEIAATTIGRTFRVLDSAVRDGGDRLEEIAAATDMTSEAFARLFREDRTAAVQKFIEALGRIGDEGGSTARFLGQFGLKMDRILKVLPALGKNSEILAKSLRLARTEAEDIGSALADELAPASQTVAARLQVLDSTWTAFGNSLSESNGGIADMVDLFTELVRAIGDATGLLTQFEQRATNLRFARLNQTELLDKFQRPGLGAGDQAAILEQIRGRVARQGGNLGGAAINEIAIRGGFDARQFLSDRNDRLVSQGRLGETVQIPDLSDQVRPVGQKIALAIIDEALRTMRESQGPVAAAIASNQSATVVTAQRPGGSSMFGPPDDPDLLRRRQGEDNIREFLRGLERENALLGMSVDEQEKALVVEEARRLARAASVEFAYEEEQAVRALVDANQAAARAAEERLRIQEAIADSFATVAQGIFDAVRAGDTLADTLRNIADRLGDIVFQETVIASIRSGVGGYFGGGGAPTTPPPGQFPAGVASARGNAFMGGMAVPFASGGIPDGLINDRVIFPLRGGRVGVAGEAGVEGSARLKRLGNGDMGVSAEGMGRQTTVHLNFPNIRDHGGFQRNQVQIAQMLRRAAQT